MDNNTFNAENIFKCIKCDKFFPTKANLARHQKSSKSCGIESYDCSFCEKKFTSKQNLDHHLLNSCEEKKETDKQKDQEIIKNKDDVLKVKDDELKAKDDELKIKDKIISEQEFKPKK